MGENKEGRAQLPDLERGCCETLLPGAGVKAIERGQWAAATLQGESRSRD